jgi:hypothetical protein
MPAVCVLVADRGHDPRRLSGFEDDHYPVRVRSPEVGLDKFIAAALWCLDDRSVPLVGLFLHPDLKPVGRTPQHVSADRVEVSIGIKKPDDSLRLLKRLDQPVEKNPVEAAIAETDAVFVMLVEGVHGRLPLVASRHDTRSPSHLVEQQAEGYQGQSPWLVSWRVS